jgi:hypothetical protein
MESRFTTEAQRTQRMHRGKASSFLEIARARDERPTTKDPEATTPW